MGNAHYTVRRADGTEIEAGYGVPTVCGQDECPTEIDRGLAYLCGDEPGGGEHGCGDYFCGEHRYMAPEGESGDLCGGCLPETDDDGRRLYR
ncbi:hypothetical protein [Kitasatospora sp. NPDC056800]|uniref:hypothetical protein n=1 Tax=Kitasatospora sp. NPDC056800 TaxID=3345948 RepID=UPI003683BCF5